jgi:SAM-dependent methyltransferase
MSPLSHIREHPEIDRSDLRVVSERLGHSARVLDLGAGRGGFVREARERGLHAWALDIEPSALPFWRANGIQGVLADAFAPPFQERSFDLIRLKELIEHVEDPRSLVESATRLMRKDGILLAHVPSSWSQLYPAGNFWDDYTHVRPFSRLGLVRLMEDSGLRVLRINGYVLGRNAIESAIGKALAYILPHTYRVIAEMPFDS